MKNGLSSLNRDFGHLRPGDPGRVALVAPPGEASLVARRLDPAWSVEEMWEPVEVALGLRRCDLILFAPGGPGPSKVPGGVDAVTGVLATVTGMPAVLRLPGRDHPSLEEISSRLDVTAIALSGEDDRLAEAVQEAALEPFMSAVAALVGEETGDWALRKAVSEVVTRTPPPAGRARAMTEEGRDPFPRRVEELARSVGCSLAHVKRRARSEGMKPARVLEANRAFQGLARYRSGRGTAPRNESLARRLGYRSARALRKAASRRFPGGVLALRDRRLTELAKPLLRAAGAHDHHIEVKRNSHAGTF